MYFPITRLLEDKEDGIIGPGGTLPEDDRMFRYPIQYIIDGKLYEGWLQDAIETKEPHRYELKLSILRKNKSQIDLPRLACVISDPQCRVNWDLVTCANFKVQNEEGKPKFDLLSKF